MELPCKTSTWNNLFTSDSLAPSNKPDATEHTPSTYYSSEILQVLKVKEAFEERCKPFFEESLAALEAQQADAADHICPFILQHIEYLYELYKASIYTNLEEDYKMILFQFQEEQKDQEQAFDVFVRQFYNQKEKDFF